MPRAPLRVRGVGLSACHTNCRSQYDSAHRRTDVIVEEFLRTAENRYERKGAAVADEDPPGGVLLSGENNVAVRIKLERETRGWSTNALSDRLNDAGFDMNPSAVWRIENGRRRINLDEAIGFADVFGLDLRNLVGPRSSRPRPAPWNSSTRSSTPSAPHSAPTRPSPRRATPSTPTSPSTPASARKPKSRSRTPSQPKPPSTCRRRHPVNTTPAHPPTRRRPQTPRPCRARKPSARAAHPHPWPSIGGPVLPHPRPPHLEEDPPLRHPLPTAPRSRLKRRRLPRPAPLPLAQLHGGHSGNGEGGSAL